MFKKLFRSLTKSKSEIFAEDLEQFANSIAVRSPQLAETMRRFIALKRQIDERKSVSNSAVLPIENLDALSQRICEAIRAHIEGICEMETEYVEAVVSRDPKRFSRMADTWRSASEGLLRAYAVLHRAATGTGQDFIEADLGPYLEAGHLKDAIDSLTLEVRTAERIRDEL